MTDTKQHPERRQPAAPAPVPVPKQYEMAPWTEALLMLVGGAGIVLVMGACLTLAGAPFIASTTLISVVLLFLLLTEEKSGSLLSYAALAIGVLLVPGIFVWAGAGELVAGMALHVIVVSAWGASLPRFCSRSCWSSAVFGSQIAWPAGSWRHVASWVS